MYPQVTEDVSSRSSSCEHSHVQCVAVTFPHMYCLVTHHYKHTCLNTVDKSRDILETISRLRTYIT